MGKLLICIIAIFSISVGLLQLRQQRLNTRYDMNRLHRKIEASQATLWNQQLKIASSTTPEALDRMMRQHDDVGRGEPAPEGGSTGTGGDVQDKRWLKSRVTPQ
jgi:hypothetical protein